MLRDEIIQILSEHREELREKYKVKSLALFGSVARGEERPDSDVDILVEFQEVVSLFTITRIERELSLLLGRKVDVVDRESIIPQLKKHILKEPLYV